ncbi:MAG: type II toxin-antitoxin system Phd/YefM family antitoxin [Candidatus Omnitrophica bacterium]|nr:type II toxin-antitoxin system Phd/YefM family antitoxin [Candidatus Omnitrophota bacterium]
MVAINVRELTHHFAKYLGSVKKGERFVIMERDKPVAEIIPHWGAEKTQGWKRKIKRVKLKGPGLSASEMVIKLRQEERF